MNQMAKQCLALLATICLLGVTTRAGEKGPALSLDPGGFTVDMTKMQGAAVAGPNLLKNGSFEEVDGDGAPVGWKSGLWVYLQPANAGGISNLEKRVGPMVDLGVDENVAFDGRRSAKATLPDPRVLPSDPPGIIDYYPYWQQDVPVPVSSNATSYVLSFRYRGTRDLGALRSGAWVHVTALPAGKANQVIVKQREEWQVGELCFSVPAGAKQIRIRLLLRYCGEVWFDAVSLHRAGDDDADAALSARVMPWYFLKDRFCLSEADPATLVFGFRANDRRRIVNPRLVVQLPEGVEILDMTDRAQMVTNRVVADGNAQEYHIDVKRWKGTAPPPSGRWPFATWMGLSLLLKTSRPASETLYTARYWIEDEGYRTASRDFEIQIVPPINGAPAPRRYQSGAFLYMVAGHTKPEGVDAFASLYQKCGSNMVFVGESPLNAELGRRGIIRYAQPFVNGYSVGGRKPGNAVFRDVNGKPVRNGVCPTEVYEQGEYFKTEVRDGIFRRILVTERTAEQLMGNWEPHVFQGKGCFCERCKKEFLLYSKLTPDELDRIWPKQVIAEQGETWIRFRSWQHGRVVATLEETIHALSDEAGRELHFFPAVSYRLLTRTARGVGEYMIADYFDAMHAWMPWGPYNWSIFGRGPYNYVRGRHLNCHASARQVLASLERNRPDDRDYRLIAYPYGTYEGATEPEAIAFEVLTYFVNGYDGTFVYLFPGGYDARYWQAMADANRLIARFEDYVFAGEVKPRHRIVSRTPLPKVDPTVLKEEVYPLLLSWKYELDGKRLIAVGNFWEESECFFDLTVDGLDRGEKHVVHEPAFGRVYADDKGQVGRDADSLKQGTLLHVGAMRYAFFVVEPWREEGEYGTCLRPRQMQDGPPRPSKRE